MIRSILVSVVVAVLLVGCSYEVRTVRSKPTMAAPGGLLYALPRTDICVDITLGHYDTVGAPFRSFADEMLSLASLPQGYEVQSVQISSRVQADPAQYYFVRPRGLAIQVDDRNLLRSIGVVSDDWSTDISYDEDEDSPAGLVRRQILDYNLYDRSDTFYTRFDHPGHPSMIATKKDSRTLRAQAQAAAERIGQLQDRRQQLLSGEYEASYTPEGIRLLLQLIDREEQQIQQQFVGRYVTERHRFTYTPRDEKQFIDSQSVVLFYFSPDQGIVDSAAPSGVPVRCSFRCDNKLRNAARFVKYRLGLFGKNDVNDRNTFKYRRSEQAQVVVSSPYFTVQQMLPVAQFGPTIELPAEHFKAVFDSHTGDLIYFEN